MIASFMIKSLRGFKTGLVESYIVKKACFLEHTASMTICGYLLCCHCEVGGKTSRTLQFHLHQQIFNSHFLKTVYCP
uniref:Uncharacterized protein n=1 Tax=Anguilla anguilla TaxID=7936 RepID=A0A0E9TYT6_ANGAN